MLYEILGKKREKIYHIREIHATTDTDDSAEATENFIERPQPDDLQEERRKEGVPAQVQIDFNLFKITVSLVNHVSFLLFQCCQ